MKIKESQQEKMWGNSKCKGSGAGMSLVRRSVWLQGRELAGKVRADGSER